MKLLLFFLTGVIGVTILCFGRFLGEKGATRLALGGIWFSFFLSFFYFVDYLKNKQIYLLEGPIWFRSGFLEIQWSFFLDGLSLAMLLVILSVSSLVHTYSLDYMKGDPHLPRFLSYLSLFTFFMILLVTSTNLLQLFLGWEGVGLCSYLLINFWFTRKQANKSALKAMVVNRLGDISLMLSFGLLYCKTKSLDFSVLFLLVPYLEHETFYFLGFTYSFLDVVCFFLFLGAMGKSAQLGLHLWLPDAMEGPTPVSALIHAATMVTAGVFLVVRFSFFFEHSENMLMFITIVGALTSLFAASTGLFQYDLKKVIAYSTCSQLGYMFLACGISGYDAAMFHLFTHAFFKALLFLGAGGVIHSLGDEQDMRKMGGLSKLLPFTYASMLIGSLSLMGFPFLSGFYSKEWILELTASNLSSPLVFFAYNLGVLSTFLTAFYSVRLIYFTFLSLPRASKVTYGFVHEVPLKMGFTLLCLTCGSIFFGYLFRDLFVGLGSTYWAHSIYFSYEHFSSFEAEFLPFYLKLIPLIFGIGGGFVSYMVHRFYSRFLLYFLREEGYVFLNFLNKKWYLDDLANSVVCLFLKEGYQSTFKGLDRGWLEWLGPSGIVFILRKVSEKISHLQTGYLYHYLGLMVFSLVCFMFLLCLEGQYSFLLIGISFIYLKLVVEKENSGR